MEDTLSWSYVPFSTIIPPEIDTKLTGIVGFEIPKCNRCNIAYANSLPGSQVCAKCECANCFIKGRMLGRYVCECCWIRLKYYPKGESNYFQKLPFEILEKILYNNQRIKHNMKIPTSRQLMIERFIDRAF